MRERSELPLSCEKKDCDTGSKWCVQYASPPERLAFCPTHKTIERTRQDSDVVKVKPL